MYRIIHEHFPTHDNTVNSRYKQVRYNELSASNEVKSWSRGLRYNENSLYSIIYCIRL